MSHTLPELGFKYDALEPSIDAKTMEIHHSKHHAAYVAKLNAALEGHPDLADKSARELIGDLDQLPESIRNAVRNNGGGHLNHSFFWQVLKKNVDFKGEVAETINAKFGSLDKFKDELLKTALGVFGSGWAWLVVDKSGELKLMGTSNQDSPITCGCTPLLCIDVWEHAYYLKYQNLRPDYVKAVFNVLNWETINEFYLKTLTTAKSH